jgi:hypothetical protein
MGEAWLSTHQRLKTSPLASVPEGLRNVWVAGRSVLVLMRVWVVMLESIEMVVTVGIAIAVVGYVCGNVFEMFWTVCDVPEEPSVFVGPVTRGAVGQKFEGPWSAAV